MNGTNNSVIKGISVNPTISLLVSVLSTVNPGGVNKTNAGKILRVSRGAQRLTYFISVVKVLMKL